jgi:hypothetical protein
MFRLCLAGLLVMTLVVMVGCGDGYEAVNEDNQNNQTPTTPPGSDFSGNWTGTITDVANPSGTLAAGNFSVNNNNIFAGYLNTPNGRFDVTGGTLSGSTMVVNFQNGGLLTANTAPTISPDYRTVSGPATYVPPNGGDPVSVTYTFSQPQ